MSITKALALFTVLLLGVLSLAFDYPNDEAQSLKVMSFNIRYNNPDDGPNAWPHRKEMVANLIQRYQVDIVGTQEVLIDQIADLESLLPEYACIGVGRDDGVEKGEFSAIYYRKGRLAAVDLGTFWLSLIPEIAGSVGWDAALPRICTWAKFRDTISGEEFYFFNAHFDHRGSNARLESAKLIAARIKELSSGLPALLAGDFNSTPDSAAITLYKEKGMLDALSISQTPALGPDWTFHGFKGTGQAGNRIDYIFVNKEGGIAVLNHNILTDNDDGRFPSDHLPVLAEITLSR